MENFLKTLWAMLIMACVLMMSGCGAELVPVMDSADKTLGYTKDASVLKEQQVHQTLRNRDTEYSKAYAKSGLTLDWQVVEERIYLPGMTEPYILTRHLPKITFRESPRFDQPLPTEPSRHPIWNTADNLINKGLWGFLGWQFAEVARGYADSKGATYNGPYSPNYINSNNRAGEGQSFDAGGNQYQGQVNPALESSVEGLPEGFVAPGCSAESRAEGRC